MITKVVLLVVVLDFYCYFHEVPAEWYTASVLIGLAVLAGIADAILRLLCQFLFNNER